MDPGSPRGFLPLFKPPKIHPYQYRNHDNVDEYSEIRSGFKRSFYRKYEGRAGGQVGGTTEWEAQHINVYLSIETAAVGSKHSELPNPPNLSGTQD
mmetsp:Transcript_33587/g.54062  ORF Transcript_33587/g.54062 Transcript_33587/m.54062 type:complete len:96 (-) Transcript_33587:934-1221(-)